MTNLEKQLRRFTQYGLSPQERQQILTGTEPPLSFQEIASELLCGYFLIESGKEQVRILPTEVELYYHEEEGNIKDSIVYHKNPAEGQTLPPFQLGILHSHYSGIDLTFEHVQAHQLCRASALIRAFKVIDGKTDEVLDIQTPDHRSTYFPKALLGQFSVFEGFSIRWTDSNHSANPKDLTCMPRIGMKDNSKCTSKEAHRKWNFRLTLKDEDTNLVYLSEWMGDSEAEEGFPEFFERLKKTLTEAHIPYKLLGKNLCNDYWIRDFMPIQLEEDLFLKYKFQPDYLFNDPKKRKYITNSFHACKELLKAYKETSIIMDGGNVVPCGNCIVMTDKVFTENGKEKGDPEFLNELRKAFGGREVITLPWKRPEEDDLKGNADVYGHADGFLKYLGNQEILLSNCLQEPQETMSILRSHGYRVTQMDFSSVASPSPDYNWAYINFLQVGKTIILPKFNIEEDDIALKTVQKAVEGCTVHQIEMRKIAEQGGALHCLTWNIRDNHPSNPYNAVNPT